MLVKTSELIGPALDWAVATAEGLEQYEGRAGALCWYDLNGDYFGPCDMWSPSTDWSQGGPLIEKYRVELVTRALDWQAMVDGFGYWLTGETALIAACRAIVAAKLGDQVDVPDELMQS